MDRQTVLDIVFKRLEDRKSEALAQLVDDVPNDLAGVFLTFYQKGFCKGITEVQHIYTEVLDELNTKDGRQAGSVDPDAD